MKAWNEARKQLLIMIARGGGELSKVNILRENRSSYVSTDFLFNELCQNEIIRIVERPFGSFVQLRSKVK